MEGGEDILSKEEGRKEGRGGLPVEGRKGGKEAWRESLKVSDSYFLYLRCLVS